MEIAPAPRRWTPLALLPYNQYVLECVDPTQHVRPFNYLIEGFRGVRNDFVSDFVLGVFFSFPRVVSDSGTGFAARTLDFVLDFINFMRIEL